MCSKYFIIHIKGISCSFVYSFNFISGVSYKQSLKKGTGWILGKGTGVAAFKIALIYAFFRGLHPGQTLWAQLLFAIYAVSNVRTAVSYNYHQASSQKSCWRGWDSFQGAKYFSGGNYVKMDESSSFQICFQIFSSRRKKKKIQGGGVPSALPLRYRPGYGKVLELFLLDSG